VCIGEYVHYPLLIKSLTDINNGINLTAVIQGGSNMTGTDVARFTHK